MLSDWQVKQFRGDLLQWFDRAQRDLPWRRTRDPYAIWVSEIMLQQTRVAAAIPFYERFLERFPTIADLAASSERDLLTIWAGLGYYYRAHNMRRAAGLMQQAGGFPKRHEEILKLPGVGGYTAAAIASIAFDEPHAAVDGNVVRVLSRLFNDGADSASHSGKKHFAALAEHTLERARPGAFNQAMMELGATICLPGNPHCLVCPVAQLCEARREGTQSELPFKVVRAKQPEERRRVFWIENGGQLLVWQRPPDARLMPGFWELPEAEQLPCARSEGVIGSFRHAITIHRYRFEVCRALPPVDAGVCKWVGLSALPALPLSTVFKKARRIAENLDAMARVRVTSAGAA